MASDVRSFIDLRDFAASAEVPAAGDYRTARTALPLADGPCSVDLLALDGGAGSDSGLPGDEFVIVLAGSLQLGEITLAADACAVIPRGVAFDWQAAPGTRALAMRYVIDTPAADRIVPIDEGAELTLQPAAGGTAGRADAVVPQPYRLSVERRGVHLRHLGFDALSPYRDALSPS
ncbi:hypothetical protein ACVOMT_15045 [Sphingomonas panni]